MKIGAVSATAAQNYRAAQKVGKGDEFVQQAIQSAQAALGGGNTSGATANVAGAAAGRGRTAKELLAPINDTQAARATAAEAAPRGGPDQLARSRENLGRLAGDVARTTTGRAPSTGTASPGSAEAARSAYESKGFSASTGTARGAAAAQTPRKPSAEQVKEAIGNAQAALYKNGVNVLA